MLGRVKHFGQLAQVKSRSVYFRSSGRIPDEASPAGNYSRTRFGEIEELRPRSGTLPCLNLDCSEHQPHAATVRIRVADLFSLGSATYPRKLSRRLQAMHAANDTNANSTRSSESWKMCDHVTTDTISASIAAR